VEVERTPSPPPSPYYYSENENTPSHLLPSSSYLHSYGNRIEKFIDPQPERSRSYNEPEQSRSYSDNYPPHPENSVDSIIDDTRTATFIPVNSAEQTTSSTVQEGNVVNIAVQYYESGRGFDEYSTTDAQNVAQMSIVIDEDTTSRSSNEPHSSMQLYQCHILN
jgi:hypothetical protein